MEKITGTLRKREAPKMLAGRLNRQPRSLPHERGFSLIELLVVIAIILIILSIAVPQMAKMRMNAQEMAAVEEISTINKAQTQYYSQFNQYATSLGQLGPPASGGAAEGPQASGLIPTNLATGASGGYNFTVTQSPQGYAVVAVPKTFGTTGRRTFYSDQSGVTRQNWGQDPATPNSPQL